MSVTNSISAPIDQNSARLLVPNKIDVPLASNEDKLKKAADDLGIKEIAIAGGVSANSGLRTR